MNRDESIALWRQGRRAWNSWANDMLAKKAELKEAAPWQTSYLDGTKVSSDEARAWVEAASVNFSGLRFTQRTSTEGSSLPATCSEIIEVEADAVDFSSFVFPWQVDFQNTQFDLRITLSLSRFYGPAKFNNTSFHKKSSFSASQFYEEAYFFEAEFHQHVEFGGIDFEKVDGGDVIIAGPDTGYGGILLVDQNSIAGGAEFHKIGWFKDTRFHDSAGFLGVHFHDRVHFPGARFQRANFKKCQFDSHALYDCAFFGGAFFNSANFKKEAIFSGVEFLGSANFGNARFRGYAVFANSIFRSSASFVNAVFEWEERPKVTDFTGIKAERAFEFSGASFSQVPRFCQADFKQAPDFDGVTFKLPNAVPFARGDPDLIPRYRAIRRMAIQAGDYEREQVAFKGELRSKRFTVDKTWHAALWLGILYDGIADCGRSIVRPFVAWVTVIALFAALYLANAGVSTNRWESACAGSPMQKWERAISLSLSVGVPLIGNSRSEEVRLFYECISDQPQTSGGSRVPLSTNILQVAEFDTKRCIALSDPACCTESIQDQVAWRFGLALMIVLEGKSYHARRLRT